MPKLSYRASSADENAFWKDLYEVVSKHYEAQTITAEAMTAVLAVAVGKMATIAIVGHHDNTGEDITDPVYAMVQRNIGQGVKDQTNLITAMIENDATPLKN